MEENKNLAEEEKEACLEAEAREVTQDLKDKEDSEIEEEARMQETPLDDEGVDKEEVIKADNLEKLSNLLIYRGKLLDDQRKDVEELENKQSVLISKAFTSELSTEEKIKLAQLELRIDNARKDYADKLRYVEQQIADLKRDL